MPLHIVQRRIDRQGCFFSGNDRRCHLGDLRKIAFKRDCRTHADVLVGNHAHLLATPRAARDAGRMMQSLSRRKALGAHDSLVHRRAVYEALGSEPLSICAACGMLWPPPWRKNVL